MIDDYLNDVKITKEQREKIGNRMCELSQVGKVYIPPTSEMKERVILDFREVLDFLDSITESDDKTEKTDCKLCDGKSLLNQDNSKDLKFNNMSHEEKISHLREMLNSMEGEVSQKWFDYTEEIIDNLEKGDDWNAMRMLIFSIMDIPKEFLSISAHPCTNCGLGHGK